MPASSFIAGLIAVSVSVVSDVDKLDAALNCTSPLSKNCIGPAYDYLDKVCAPRSASGSLNLTYPCNQNMILNAECSFGRTFNEVWNTTSGQWMIQSDWTDQSNEDQRLCACESQFFDTFVGCSDCYQAHGGPIQLTSDKAASSISSSYCAATNTPTVGLNQMLVQYYKASNSRVLSAATARAKTSTFSDPLLGSKAVSYYYTPSVTGTAVFNIAGVTHGSKPTETNVAHGQITSGAEALMGELQLKVTAAALVGLAALVTLL